MVWIPIPGLQKRIEYWLDHAWEVGVTNSNQIIAYTLQFIPVISAMNISLSRADQNEVLGKAAVLADDPYDWYLLRFGSADLDNQIRRALIDGLLWLPRKKRWKARYLVDLRIDTPARCACAGFYAWYNGKTVLAAKAFAGVKEIRHGPELHGIAKILVIGEAATDIVSMIEWKQHVDWIDDLPDPELRPGTLQALRDLRAVAVDVTVAHHSEAPLNRSAALNRASARLKRLIETLPETCPFPEWPLLKGIADSWQKIVISVGGEVGEAVLREPELNPYEGYSGLPVSGRTFIGRQDIIRQTETCWASSELLPALFLYGHRRMGKTSILRNLGQTAAPGTILVYLDMQDSGWVDHTGQLLLDLAEGIHKSGAEAGLEVGEAPAADEYTDLGTARRALNHLLDRIDPQMADRRMILAIDEFELIEKGIGDGRIDAGLIAYLRALNQRHRWLALIFGGLHTLEEMARDYRSAFWGQAEHIRVSYLEHDDAIRLITRPHPDFALEYAPELREEIFRLTYGQPYLLQRICWELVNRWNERFLEYGETTPRTIEMADLEPVLSADLFANAEYYFDGVWSNITEAERSLMPRLAERSAPWDLATLEADGHEETLELLKRHDVIVEEPTGVRYASELMRRWVKITITATAE
jgi:hypothetical protein